ncbi:PrgI family protein [Thomasclavelia cocleata]|uniref:PrgI family protein n=2 Tax=Thomasclavelia cocleata TaxID=69824 RepID=UPI002494DD53|nr:PrgI family protein [Thomasclavelia cocleata]
MIYVPVPKEIKEYEKKIFKNLTLRQLVWLIIGVGLAIIIYLLLIPFFSSDILSYIIMTIVIPCFLCGFVKIQDIPFDIYINIVLFNTLHIQKLLYDNEIRFFRKGDKCSDFKKKKRTKRNKIKETI